MAKQIAFTPPPLTPKPEFRNRTPAATEERAEALLAAYELLEVARRGEAIDLAKGIIGARTAIAQQLAEFASKPEAIAAMRNLIVMGKILAALDSDVVSNFARELKVETTEAKDDAPPSLWQLTKHANHPDVRRGLAFMLHTMELLGRAVQAKPADGNATHHSTKSQA